MAFRNYRNGAVRHRIRPPLNGDRLKTLGIRTGERVTSAPTVEQVRAFYDGETTRKLRDYVSGNQRVEAAERLIVDAMRNRAPRRVLEIGSGVGYTSAEMARRWPGAEVVGLDVSPRSTELAQALFEAPNLRYVTGKLHEVDLGGRFDLIVMIDTYEHIDPAERPELLDQLGRLTAADATVITTTPTPRFQAWLRRHKPAEMQPVDEDIRFEEIDALAQAVGGFVELFRLVSIWRPHDYTHAVVRVVADEPAGSSGSGQALDQMVQRLVRRVRRFGIRRQRRRLVEQRLSIRLR